MIFVVIGYLLCGLIGIYLLLTGIVAIWMCCVFGGGKWDWEYIVGPVYIALSIVVFVAMYFHSPFTIVARM